MSFEWDTHAAVERTSADTFSAVLDGGWSVGGGINGGYQMGVLGTAVSHSLPQHPDPFVLSAYFLSAATAGPAEVQVTPLRPGRTSSTVRAELRQDGEVRLTALATFGDLASLPTDDVRVTAAPPELAPREQCVPGSMAPEEVRRLAPLMERFEMLFDPSCIGWAVGEPSGVGRFTAWFRLADGRDPDPVTLLMVLDALPPVTFDLGRPGWAPTVELTAHVRAVPAPGWLRITHATRNVGGGMFEEDCEVWDSADRLVAQSRQLAKLPR
ncbi:MAG: thioesterase family protein [Nocardioides sp.]|uniref:thioesterase family protein n=1 Tax=Nocardioides sp. TaxID=35761 RepID=UPI003F114DBF